MTGTSETTGELVRLFYLPMKFPVVYQTFLRREMEGLEAAGCEVTVVPCLPGGERKVEHRLSVLRLYGNVMGILRGVWKEYAGRPHRILRGVRIVMAHPPNHLESWFFLVGSVLLAPVVAEKVRHGKIQHIHGAWATAPATVAWLVHKLTGIPFSFGAQAYDLYRRGGDNFLEPKSRDAAFIHTTTRNNVRTLKERIPGDFHKVVLARRGLPALPPPRIPAEESKEIRLLSVGRLVAKKGHLFQLKAARILKDQGHRVRMKWVGEGNLRQSLEAACREMNLVDEVELCGQVQPEEVAQFFAWADLFLHTGIVADSGDRDGLPNAVPEAMAYEVPVICGVEPGVLEAVEDGATGRVVDPEQVDQLAALILELKQDKRQRERLALGGRKWVTEHFLASVNAGKIAEQIRAHRTGERR